MPTLDAYIQQHRERFVSELLDYVRIPSISQTGEGIQAAIDFLCRSFSRLGASTQVLQTSGNPIVLAEVGPAHAPFTLLVYGHYDVVPAQGQAGWRTEPFEPVVEGDRIWGRGTGDNKSQHLARIFGVELYQRAIGDLPIKIKFLIEGEEEVGSKGFITYVKQNPGAFKADLCCYSDAPMFPNDQPVLYLGVRGMLQLEFKARGAVRGLHSGLFGGIAPSPLFDLCALFTKLADADGRLHLPGIDQAGSHGAADMEALKRLPLDYDGIVETMGIAPTTGRDAYAFYRNLLCRHNFNISGFSGGYTGEGARNAIPHEATAKADIRVAGGGDIDAIFAAIQSVVEREGQGRISVTRLSSEPPSKTPVDHPYVAIVARAVTNGFGRAPLLVPSMGATTPDYVFTRVLGMPSILVPYAPYDESNHAANESTKVSLYLNGIKTSACIIRELAA
jgi:acetylornithine deacetylase/succinyl-diaminopimelate desuccinylase-like protein